MEKDGRIGLQREGSRDSIPLARKLSGESSVSTPTAGTENSNPFDNTTQTPAKANLKDQPTTEPPRADSANKDAAPARHEAHDAKAGPATSSETQSKKTGTDGTVSKESPSGNAEAPQREAVSTNGTASGNNKGQGPSKEIKTTTRTARPPPKHLTAASTTKPVGKPEKSPTAVDKAPESPTETSAHHPVPKKTPERKTQQPDRLATPRETPASKPADPSSIKKPPSLQASPAGPAFVKPKPKSPTRPVKLPPSLTTHTAASGSKINVTRQTLSRASGNAQAADTQARAASRTSSSTTGTAPNKPAVTKTLKRQSSTIGRPRPSLGPPPKQSAKDHPPTRREKEIDEGFLARMMRPTQASASKTTEKVQITPPRRVAATGPKKPATVKPMRKAVGRSPGAASSSGQSQTSAAQKVAVEAEHVAPSDEADETAKGGEGDASLPAASGQESTAQEVAPLVEQSATAEEVIEVAKEAEGQVTLPEASGSVGKLAPSLMPKGPEPEPEPTMAPEESDASHHNDTEAAAPESKELGSSETPEKDE